MEVIGKLRQILPEQRGESARGPWVRGGFVIDLDSPFPRSIAFSTWGEDMLANLKSIKLGDTIQVTFEIDSREYNGRWYTDCRCRNIGAFVSNINGNSSAQYSQSAQNASAAPASSYQRPNNEIPQQDSVPTDMGGTISNEVMPEDNSEDDLPF